VSFQSLKIDAQWWIDAAPPEGSGGAVAYVPSGRSWIAIGTPLADDRWRATAVRRFCAAARASGHRPIFFGIEDRQPFTGCRLLTIGLQSVLRPVEWDTTLHQRPRLREQLRRARAKKVTVRRVDAAELLPGTTLRAGIDRLRREWLSSRAMEPLDFLVAVQPFYAADEHRYFVAERGGVPVQFLSSVPICGRHGWLMEDMLRGTSAPNGTTELLIDAMMRSLTREQDWLTPGLTPLTGAIAWWLRVVRFSSTALYDFSGLLRFRSRLHPAAWREVSLAWDRGWPPFVLLDVLRAFAGGRPVRFASRSLFWHANGPPWVIAVPLVVWTAWLAGLVVFGYARLLGYSTMMLARWVGFDIAIAWLLFKVAHRPHRWFLVAIAALVMGDAILSIRHLAEVGLGPNVLTAFCRLIATTGPIVGTAALAWAASRARRSRRG
jgi:phosphatidylglycerol lysyltransferase